MNEPRALGDGFYVDPDGVIRFHGTAKDLAKIEGEATRLSVAREKEEK